MTEDNLKLARQIYLEIYNYPEIVAKLQEHGFSEAEAAALASTAFEEVTLYEEARDTAQSDFYSGTVLTIIGLLAACLVFESDNIDPKAVPLLIVLSCVTFGGVMLLGKWFTKRKVIKRFEADLK